ncbi:hypothetical protein D8676_18355 [Mesorhizobium sp. YM1C-6-2]|nr:hypothetical protein D8676_18355 [Mesorhizobium sp. YM1C-6-2]
MLSNIVQLVFAMLDFSITDPSPMDTGPDVTLIPFELRRFEAALRCKTHYPFIGIVWSQVC